MRWLSHPSVPYFAPKTEALDYGWPGGHTEQSRSDDESMFVERASCDRNEAAEIRGRSSAATEEREVLVRVRSCGVCRTDLHVIEGELPPRKSPVIPGHQVVGVIEKRGEGTKRFAVGGESGLPGFIKQMGLATTAAPERRISAIILRSPATAWMAAMRNTSLRRKLLCMRSPTVFRMNRPRRCSARESLVFVRCGSLESKRADAWVFYGFGAAAHVAIQVALHWGAEVYASTRDARHQKLALELGATWAGGTF